jgi:hypothetical protein
MTAFQPASVSGGIPVTILARSRPMPALGIMGVTTPAERLTKGGVEGSIYSRRRFVPVATYRPSGCCIANTRAARARTGRFGVIPSSHLGGVGLDLILLTSASGRRRCSRFQDRRAPQK